MGCLNHDNKGLSLATQPWSSRTNFLILRIWSITNWSSKWELFLIINFSANNWTWNSLKKRNSKLSLQLLVLWYSYLYWRDHKIWFLCSTDRKFLHQTIVEWFHELNLECAKLIASNCTPPYSVVQVAA